MCREVAGYSEQTHSYSSPSLALKLGHSFRKCTNFLKNEGLKENDDKVKTANGLILYHLKPKHLFMKRNITSSYHLFEM